MWQATTPAVSVRSLLFPNDTGMNPPAMAASTSSVLKSPSGPMRTSVFVPGLQAFFSRILFSWS